MRRPRGTRPSAAATTPAFVVPVGGVATIGLVVFTLIDKVAAPGQADRGEIAATVDAGNGLSTPIAAYVPP
jgi:hypothetical protein